MDRLHKVLSHAGVASRRAAERLILEGRVTVNGTIVDTLGTKVDPERDVIKVDGKRVRRPPATRTYLMANKPRGYVTTLSDPEGRRTVGDLLRGVRPRVYPVGRLDYDSEGLLLLTDDGVLARDLMHPRNAVPKTYLFMTRGRPSEAAIRRLRRGIDLAGSPTLPAKVRLLRSADNVWLEITVLEGRKRQVRRMFRAVGHPVVRLKRIRYGGVDLGNLASGQVRTLTAGELRRLRRAVESGGGGSHRRDTSDRT